MALVTHMNALRFSYVRQGTEERSAATPSHIPPHPCEGSALDPLDKYRAMPAAPNWRHAVPFEQIGDEPLDAIINVRLTTEEKDRLRDDADIADMSMSALVRARYFGRPVVANVDVVMVKELKRLGRLLKHLHNESGGVLGAQSKDVLISIRKYIDTLQKKNGSQ